MTKDETKESQESHRSYGRWWDLGVRAWAIIGCAIVFVLVVRALGMLGQTFTLLLTGIIVGFICSPITNFLEDRGVGRAAGAFVALVVVLAVLAGTLLVLVPPFSEQMLRLLRRVPYYMGQMRTASDELYAVMGSSVDLFDEAIELGSKAVDMVDDVHLTAEEAAQLEADEAGSTDQPEADEAAGTSEVPDAASEDAPQE